MKVKRKFFWLLALNSWLLAASPMFAMDTLVCLNAQRASLGLYPLLPDPELQQAAEDTARKRAVQHMNGHWKKVRRKGRIVAVPVAGRWEGTARRSSQRRGPAGELWGPEDVYACYQSHTRARYAGVSSVLGADGYWYYQINLR